MKPSKSAAFYDEFVRDMQPHMACIRMPSQAGEVAFETMAAIQIAMQERGYSLNSNEYYKILGWKGRADFEKVALDHARIAAQAKLEALNQGTHYRTEDFDELFMWLERANQPLFAHATYSPLFSSTTRIRTSVLDVNLKSISDLLRRVYVLAEEPEYLINKAIPLFEETIKTYLPRIGQPIDQLQFTWGDKAPITVKQMESMMRARAACILWRNAREKPFKGVPRAHERQLLEACIHLKQATITDQERYFFEPLRITAGYLETKRYEIIKRLLEQDLRYLGPQPWNVERLKPVAARILELRKLMPEQNIFHEDDLNLGMLHPDEDNIRDSWMIDVFESFDHPSFGAFIKRAYRIIAVEQVRATLAAPDMHLVDKQNAFNSSSAMIAEYNLTDLPESEFYSAYNIDPVEYREALSTASFAGAFALWQHIARIDQTVASKIEALNSLDLLLGQMPEGIHEDIGITANLLQVRQRKLHKRQAQNLIFESLCYAQPSYGAKKLEQAWALLEEIDANMSEPRIFRAMGLSESDAATIRELYTIESIAAHFEKASNEQLKLHERFDAISAFWDHYSTYNINSDFAVKLLDRLGLPNHTGIMRTVKSLAKIFALVSFEALKAYDDDPSSAISVLKDCDRALTLLHPQGTSDPVILRDVLSISVDDYSNMRARIYKQDALTNRKGLLPEKYTQKQVVSTIRAALKSKGDPAQAYNTIMYAARMLDVSHQSITDSECLKSLGLNFGTFASKLDGLALAAARGHIMKARSLIGQTPPHDMIENHEFFEYKNALMWIGRSSFIQTSDAPYKLIGLEDRIQFLREYRRSAIALVRVLTQQLKLVGAQQGPFWYLSNIQRIRNYYEFLGIGAYDHRMAISFSDTQRAIEKMGAAAGQQIIKSSWPVSRKYKAFESLLKLMNTHHVGILPQRGQTATFRQSMRDVTMNRIETTVNRYLVNQGTPLRGLHVAMAIQEKSRTFNLAEDDWFNGIFEAQGYGDFDDFFIRKIKGAVNYISKRIDAQLDFVAGKEPDLSNYIGAYRDLNRLDLIINNSHLTKRCVDDVLNYADISDEWLATHRSVLSRKLRGWALRYACIDPTLSDDARWRALADARKLDYMINTDPYVDDTKMRSTYITAHDRILQRQAAAALMGHMVRVSPQIIGENLAEAQDLCELMGTSLKEPALRAGLCLNDLEAQNIKDQMAILPLYRGIVLLTNMSDRTGPEIAENILFCAEQVNNLSARYTYPSVLAKICSLPVEAVLERMDFAALKALSFYSQRILQQQLRRNINPDDVLCLKALHNFTMLEARRTLQTLSQQGILSMSQINNIEADMAKHARQAPVPDNVIPHPAFRARG